MATTGNRPVVIVPTYNERDNLPTLIPALLQTPSLRILVVDDGSPDGTGELADRLAGESRGRVEVMHRTGRRGLGLSYIEGMRHVLAAEATHICQMDADLSHHPDNLPEFIAMANRYDAVLGSRYVGGRVTVVNWPMGRLMISYFGSWYARTITRMPAAASRDQAARSSAGLAARSAFAPPETARQRSCRRTTGFTMTG